MLKNPSFTFKLTSLALVTSLLGLASCNFASNDVNLGLEDSSASGAVAAIIGGAILAGNPTAAAANGGSCPTVASSSGCSNISGGAGVSLSFNGCSYGGTSGTRNGTLSILAAGLTCGSAMPTSFTEQYSSGGNQISTNNVVTGFDDLTPNLSNFNGDTIATLSNGGYGVSVTPTSMNIARYAATPFTLYTVTSNGPTITISTGPTAANGSVKVYDDHLWVIGTAAVTGLTYQAGCCFPVSGSITTSFIASTNPALPPTATGALYVNNSETLQFTGCGTATFTDAISHQPTNLSFTHCY